MFQFIGFICSIYSEPEDTFDSADFPESYRQNNNKEKLVLAYAENFRKQFVHLFRDRKPLLLNPVNELQVEVLWIAPISLLKTTVDSIFYQFWLIGYFFIFQQFFV